MLTGYCTRILHQDKDLIRTFQGEKTVVIKDIVGRYRVSYGTAWTVQAIIEFELRNKKASPSSN